MLKTGEILYSFLCLAPADKLFYRYSPFIFNQHFCLDDNNLTNTADKYGDISTLREISRIKLLNCQAPGHVKIMSGPSQVNFEDLVRVKSQIKSI